MMDLQSAVVSVLELQFGTETTNAVKDNVKDALKPLMHGEEASGKRGKGKKKKGGLMKNSSMSRHLSWSSLNR